MVIGKLLVTQIRFANAARNHRGSFRHRQVALPKQLAGLSVGKIQVQQVLNRNRIPPKGATMYIEKYKAINAGVLVPQEPRSPENTTPTSFENFIRDVFEPAYHGKARTP